MSDHLLFLTVHKSRFWPHDSDPLRQVTDRWRRAWRERHVIQAGSTFGRRSLLRRQVVRCRVPGYRRPESRVTWHWRRRHVVTMYNSAAGTRWRHTATRPASPAERRPCWGSPSLSAPSSQNLQHSQNLLSISYIYIGLLKLLPIASNHDFYPICCRKLITTSFERASDHRAVKARTYEHTSWRKSTTFSSLIVRQFQQRFSLSLESLEKDASNFWKYCKEHDK